MQERGVLTFCLGDKEIISIPVFIIMYLNGKCFCSPGEFFNSELTEKLFELANALGQDLASLNIQRGRDHGIQFYNDYREHCGLSRARTFEDLRGEIQFGPTRSKLQALYGHPGNRYKFINVFSPLEYDPVDLSQTT